MKDDYHKAFESDKKYNSDDMAKDIISHIMPEVQKIFPIMQTNMKSTVIEFLDGKIDEDHFLLTVRKFYAKTLLNAFNHNMKLSDAKELFERHEPKLIYIQSQIRQSFVEDFYTTMKRHFDVSVAGKKVGYPNYVGGKHKIQTAILIKQHLETNIQPDKGILKIPQSRDKMLSTNEVHILNWHDDWTKHKMARTLIHKDHKGDFYIIVPYEVECFNIDHAKEKVGIDPGIATMLTLYDGEEFYEIQPPKRIVKYMEKLQKMSTVLSKKVRGSNRYYKLLDKINKTHRKMTNIRRDFNHKVTKRLVTKYKQINFEAADVNGWKTDNKSTRNHQLQNLLNLGQFGDFLKYKSEKYSSTYKVILGYEKATRTCSSCNHDNGKLDVTIRDFVCNSCGFEIGRDRNAAINIFNH